MGAVFLSVPSMDCRFLRTCGVILGISCYELDAICQEQAHYNYNNAILTQQLCSFVEYSSVGRHLSSSFGSASHVPYFQVKNRYNLPCSPDTVC